MATREKLNIMTSCDDNLAIYILPQLASINTNLGMYEVDFYLMHSRVTDGSLKLIRDYAATLDNVTFHELLVTDNGPFEKAATYGDARSQGKRYWPHETYYWFYAHLYLPDDMDRVMYIDAGDIVFLGDVGEYYFKDFGGKLFVASPRLMISRNGVPDVYNKGDIDKIETLKDMLSLGSFCAGVLVLNLAVFREKIKVGYIDDFVELLKKVFPGADCIYLGDQGLASAAFAGDIEFFGDVGGVDVWYRPYNFPVGYYYEVAKEDFAYTPKVAHFNASYTDKPWAARFDPEEIAKYDFRVRFDFEYAPFIANAPIIELYEEWWKCCKKTPVYEELDRRARIAAKALQNHFLPLCKSYNELAMQNHSLAKRHDELEKSFKDLLVGSPLLAHLLPSDAPFLNAAIAAVLRGDLQAALDEIFRLAEDDIPEEIAERFLELALNICAATEYADGWVAFLKALIKFLIESGRMADAQPRIEELEALLPDDEEVKAFRTALRAIAYQALQ